MADQSKEYLKQLVNETNKYFIAIDYEKLTVDGTVKSLATVPVEAKYALIQVESSISSAAIRYLEKGIPSATDGFFRFNEEAFDIIGYQNLINFKTTQIGVGTHYLHVQYYK